MNSNPNRCICRHQNQFW